MRRIALLLSTTALMCLAWLAPSAASAAFTQCPPVDLDSGCQFLITVTDSETTIESDPGLGPYEGSDDALIGIVNNSSKPISSIALSAEDELFGFENDGICHPGSGPIPPGCKVLKFNEAKTATAKPGTECGYVGEVKEGKPPLAETIEESCGFEPLGEPAITFPEGVAPTGFAANEDPVSGYEGPTSYFTGIGAVGTFATGKGVVNFSPAIPIGTATYFSLESPPVAGFGTATTLSTTLSGGGQSGASISVVQGTAVTDSATLGGANAPTATGTVTFGIYSDSECKTLVAPAGSAKLASATAGPSTAETTLAPGTYYWQARYAGNTENQGVLSLCGSEILKVLSPTATATTQTGSGVSAKSLTVPVGTAVTDLATLSGAQIKSATGTVTYTLYKDKKCTVPFATATVGTVVAGVAGPSGAVKPKVGTYYWTASYSGDAVLNGPSASACGSEVLVVAAKASGLLPSSKICLSRRKFIAHPRAPKGTKLVHVEVLINGKLKSQGKLTKHHTTINLIGLPKGTFKVSMVVTTSTGKKYADIRTFHTCVPKKHKK